MAKFIQPLIDFYGVLESHNQMTFDASVILSGGGDKALQISSALTTSTENNPYALIMEGTTGSVRSRALGTMAWEASTNYYGKSETDARYLQLSGGTLTGLLTLDSAGMTLDGVTVTTIDTSAEGVSSLDTAIPTSGAVQKLVNDTVSANVTASNGLHEEGGDIRLGGSLIEDTSIDLNTHNLAFYDQDVAIIEYTNTAISPELILRAKFENGTNNSYIKLGGGDFDESIEIGSSTHNLHLSDGNITINGNSVLYGGDYGGTNGNNYSNRSIPDWQSVKSYADSVGASSNRGASNGLQILTDGSYGLGGSLTEATTITTSATNTLTLAGLQTQTNQVTVVSHNSGVLGTTTLGSMAFESNADYVEVAGDTMTGALSITATGTALSITNNATISGTLTLGVLALGSTTTVNDIVTSISAASTDDQLATAKAVWDSRPTAGIGITETSNAFNLDITNTSTIAGTAVYAKIDDGVGNIRVDSDDIVDAIVTSNTSADVSVYRNASHELNIDITDITNNPKVATLSGTSFGSNDIRIKVDPNDDTLFIEGDDISNIAGVPSFLNGLTSVGDNSIGIGGDLFQDTDINTQGFTFSITGDTAIHGNLTVDGSLTTVNSVNLDVSDNIITVNAGESGSGVSSGFAGIRVDRGTADDYMFIFDESDDTFRIGIQNESGLPGNSQAVATREDDPNALAIPFWNSTAHRFDTASDLVLTNEQLVLNRGLALTGGLTTDNGENTALLIQTDGSVVTRELSDTAFTDGVNLTVSGPITITGGIGAVLSSTAIAINQANTSQDGYLSSTDWNTFNDKIDGVASTTGVTGGHEVYSGEDSGTSRIKQLKAGTGVSMSSDSSIITIGIDTTSTVSKYTSSFDSTGITSITITQATHGLAAGYYNISVYEAGELVYPSVSINASGDVTFEWTSGSLSGTIHYIITG